MLFFCCLATAKIQISTLWDEQRFILSSYLIFLSAFPLPPFIITLKVLCLVQFKQCSTIQLHYCSSASSSQRHLKRAQNKKNTFTMALLDYCSLLLHKDVQQFHKHHHVLMHFGYWNAAKIGEYLNRNRIFHKMWVCFTASMLTPECMDKHSL